MAINKRLSYTYFFTILFNIVVLITIKILFSVNTSGLEGIGKGIVISFLSLSALVMYIGIMFLSLNKKVFLIINFATLLIAIGYVLFLNTHSKLIKATNRKSIHQLERQMSLNNEYFKVCLKNIKNTSKILSLLKKWKNETKMLENNIQFIRPFISISLLLTLNYEENEIQLDSLIKKKLPGYSTDNRIENLEARKILQNTFDYALSISEQTLRHDLICRLYQKYNLSSIKYNCYK